MTLYIGIDISKATHVATLLSRELLGHKRLAGRLPTMKIDNSRAGFDQLLEAICLYSDPTEISVLVEHTGHYGLNLEQFLQEHGIQVFRIVGERWDTDKNDQLDSRALAIHLYNQEELHIEYVKEHQRILPLTVPSDTARRLRALVQHRHELRRETVRRQNQLTAIIDEVFPEFTTIYHDPNVASALNVRSAYPTPQDMATAPLADLLKIRRTYRNKAVLVHMQELARTTIGSHDGPRVASLIIEQRQLIAELRLMRTHIDELDREIEMALVASREGRILLSFPGIGVVNAATLLSGIGTIANFKNEVKLRGYLGWAPRQSQTGTTYDTVALNKGGNKAMKYTMCLIAFSAITRDPWQTEYNELVERVCPLDPRTGERRHKMKAIGHICGRLIRVLYILLRRDYNLVRRTPPGEPLPEPELYDAWKHRVLGMEREEIHTVHAPLETKMVRPSRDRG